MAQRGDKRGMAFAVIVVIIAAVGAYLWLWPDPEQPAAEQAASGRTTSTPVIASTPLATASDAPFDVYSFLPMSKEQLAAAADLAERFTAEYATYRFDEAPQTYADRVRKYTTADFGNILARTRTAAGPVEQDDQTVSTATAALKEIRQIEKTSIVFVITATQQLTGKSGAKQQAADYAVTVSQLGSDWRVFDLRPADEGQDGDPQG
ncbi:hypothetical protein [Nonomuraea sp. NPDC049725]|uniref:hypothetical protein n=1 Tax=Nonomuraea sp. NPDC049725 TaxID=3154508 RepID=UPI003415E552